MNIPGVPTDNLYKFAAIAGLLAVLFSFALPVRAIFDLQLRIAESETQVELLKHEAAIARRALDEAESLRKAGVSVPPKLLERADGFETMRLKAIGEGRKNQVLADQLWVLFVVAALGSYGGFHLAWWGFGRWYRLVQLPLDSRPDAGGR